MKKKLISAAILLGASSLALAGPAGSEKGADPDKAMLLNADGLGQVLFYPYYNVNDGFDTAFTVVNTSDTYRAVKVRIFEGKNSWEVLDFNLYMSPNDTWQGMLHRHEDGKVELITADTSCTLPKLNNPKKPAYLRAVDGNITEIEGKQNRNVSLFTGNRYKTQDEREAEYADPAKLIERISEGYVEVIDMGAIWRPGNIDTDVTADNYQALASIMGSSAADADALKKELKELYGKEGTMKELLDAIEHVDGVPGDCAYLDQFAHAVWEEQNPDYYIIQDDKNALSGSATMINVKKGMAGSYNAVAVKNFVMEDPAIVGVTTTTGTPPNVTTTTTYPVRDYTTAAPRAYTLHNVPSSSYPNINGQVQRVHNRQGVVIYSDAINPNVLLSYNGGTYAPLTVNDALINNKTGDTYTELEVASWNARIGANTSPTTLYPAAVSLSAIMMAQDVVGEYVIDPDLRAASDWIITMPTKHYFTNPNTTRPTNISRGLGQYGFINDFSATATADDIDALVKDASGKPVKPETVKPHIRAFQPFSNTAFDAGNPLVEVAKIVTYNREEGESTISHEFDFSPSIGLPDTGMNSEANVLHFSDDSAKKIFTSMNEHMLSVKKDFKAGWAKVSFDKQFLSNQVIDENDLDDSCKGIDDGDPAKSNFCLRGLPVIGVAATKYVNSILYVEGRGDVLSNYMGIVDLTYKRNNTVK